MNHETVPFCGKHRMSREWRASVYQHEEDGISVKVPDVHAWVCPGDGDAYFAPETVKELGSTIRELIEQEKQARERQSAPTEHLVQNGQ